MIYQKDWLMRQIEAMIQALLRLFLRTEEETVDVPLEAATQTERELRAKLDGWLGAGLLCEAEDWLFENMDGADDMWLRLAIHLYSEMNRLSDTFLEEHDFSREEIMSGLTEVCREFGYGPLMGL